MATGAGLPAETIHSATSYAGTDEDICPYVNSLSYHFLHGCPARTFFSPEL